MAIVGFRKKPVYFINGFLDSGKTSFLKFTLEQDYFRIRGNTLLILCEEGEEEYEPELIKKSKTIVEILEEQSEFTVEKLTELDKKWHPERIIIEYNGMWSNKDIKLPSGWEIEQGITCVDASTFSMYFSNMRAMVAEMVKRAELIIFNRCDDCMDSLGTFRRNIKAVNSQAEVVFENSQGEINEIFEEDLPYELSKDRIELEGIAFGIWYLDMMDHLERYEGKEVSFLAMVVKPPLSEGFPENYFVPGRMAMTCCAEDISFIGFPCEYEGSRTLKNREYINIVAKVIRGMGPGYKGPGPLLKAVSIEKAPKPKEEIISFS